MSMLGFLSEDTKSQEMVESWVKKLWIRGFLFHISLYKCSDALVLQVYAS